MGFNYCCPSLVSKVVGAVLCLTIGMLSGASDSPGEMDRWIADLEGGWVGEDNVTPLGRMPFAVLFEWQEDGSLFTHSALNRETYIDLRFRKDEGGRWLLDEETAMEGLGRQGYTLAPAGKVGPGLHRWVYAENPEFLTIDLRHDAETMYMKVYLRGEDHAEFRLRRLPDEALPELKREFAEAAQQPPGVGESIHDVLRPEEAPDSIRLARAAVAARPDDARAHLELGKALADAIQADPANGPRYAFEMLEALQTAVRLDAQLPEAYRWLAGYYLNAPAIAGGDLDKAEQAARKLTELDPEAGRAVLAQIERRREQR